MLRLVRVQIVEHHVDLLPGVVGDHLVHEGQELAAAPALGVHPADRPGAHVERREEGGGAVALVLVAGAAHRLSGFCALNSWNKCASRAVILAGSVGHAQT